LTTVDEALDEVRSGRYTINKIDRSPVSTPHYVTATSESRSDLIGPEDPKLLSDRMKISDESYSIVKSQTDVFDRVYDSDIKNNTIIKLNKNVEDKNSRIKSLEHLLDFERSINKIKDVKNICQGTVDIWTATVITTIVLSGFLLFVLSLYLIHDAAPGLIAFILCLILIMPSIVVLRGYIRNNYHVEGRRFD
jgi:hypothetical protein